MSAYLEITWNCTSFYPIAFVLLEIQCNKSRIDILRAEQIARRLTRVRANLRRSEIINLNTLRQTSKFMRLLKTLPRALISGGNFILFSKPLLRRKGVLQISALPLESGLLAHTRLYIYIYKRKGMEIWLRRVLPYKTHEVFYNRKKL